ncbi:hypothetical protein [Thalassobius sp. I31.1]|uniref:hypothetical protein n=1 Tax=Thalassobius sp. I31.1 TaxID=2109912 RepID=UPI000D19867A|nr:hypothetical protein [Thalassobius sp. I31.1]
MSFIRPEVAAHFRRWRGVLEGVAFLLVGLWMFLRLYGAVKLVGALVFLVGLGLCWNAIRRAKLRQREGGKGVIEVTERRFSWFTADGGTRFSLDDVVKIEIETNDRGPVEEDLFWYFTLFDGSRHEVAGSAAQGDTIFDLLATFPGVDYEKVIKASSSTICDHFLIWQKRD